MNNSLDKTFEENFENDFNNVMNLAESEYSYNQLISMLNSHILAERQIAALKIEKICSYEDASLLASRLINQDGKIREAVAFTINKLVSDKKYSKFFMTKDIYDIFLKAITDIDGNVCRQIVDAVSHLNFDDAFCEYFSCGLVKLIDEIWDNIVKLDLSAKQFVISKRNFQLYWALDTLNFFFKFVEVDKLKLILLTCGNFYDYTIREKVATIISKLKTTDSELLNLKTNLANDENYFVRLAIK